MEKTTFRITGMHCDACIKVSTMKLKKIPGVVEVSVSTEGEAVLWSERKPEEATLKGALSEMGYGVENIK